MLVEASSASDSNLLAAVKYASQHANVVSMSWGGGEFSGETADDSYFSVPGVAFVVASGDTGAPAEWPASSPDVLGVGGTSLTLGSGGGWGSETGWSGSTGGPSAYEPQPSYQVGVVTQTTTARATPDVAYDASSTGTYAVYDSYPDEGETLDWVAVYGTSAGARSGRRSWRSPIRVGPPTACRPSTPPAPSRLWTSCTRTRATSTTSRAGPVPANRSTPPGRATTM